MSSSLPPRPKPWETASNGNAIAGPSSQPATNGQSQLSSAFDNAVASTSSAPRIPERPANLDSTVATTGYGGTGYQSGRFGQPSYGLSPYGGMGGGMGYGSYSSPYSRFGGGGYGMGMGMGGYGMGGYGVGGMGAPGENLTSSLQASTAPAFAVIESLVTAFTSLAQLVESTYMATHSSFFAMVGVADQLGSVKTYLGQVLGVFSVLRLGKRILAWLRGKRIRTDGWANEWSTGSHPNSPSALSDRNPKQGRPSAKPLLLFLLSAVGLPWLMTRLVKLLIAHQQQQQQQGIENLDPSKLTFARAKWEFQAGEGWELSLARDEIVAVLERRDDEQQGGTGWWRGRTRDGRIGWFPGNYVEIIKRRETQA